MEEDFKNHIEKPTHVYKAMVEYDIYDHSSDIEFSGVLDLQKGFFRLILL